MAQLPALCSPAGALAVLPALLHLVTSVLRHDAAALQSPAVQVPFLTLNFSSV